MAYIINKYNGETNSSITVEDGTINNTLDIKLIGKNYAGYGEFQNENFTWLLENFAKESAPPRAIVGQLWYNTSTQKLNVNYGTGVWHTLGITDVVENKADAVNLNEGDLFWVKNTEQLWCKGNTIPVLIGGKSSAVNTEMRTREADDTVGQKHKIIEAVVYDKVIFVISYATAPFTLANTDPLAAVEQGNWTVINPGMTAKGYTSSSGASTTYKMWGSATNADNFDGQPPSEYVNQTSPVFTNAVTFPDAGFTLGSLSVTNPLDGLVRIPIIANTVSDSIYFKIKTDSLKIALRITGQDIIPGNPNNSDIGSDTARFNTVYSNTFDGTTFSGTTFSGTTFSGTTFSGTTFTGNAASADSVNYTWISDAGTLDEVTHTTVLPDVDAIDGTLVVRTYAETTFTSDGSSVTVGPGAIKANYFVGQAFTGPAADMAEKYLADATYEVGTVVMIGGTEEITAATSNCRAIGAVSSSPFIIMNAGLTGGTTIALKGRLPIKVIGIVNKGDRLIAADTGVAKSLTDADDSSLVFAIALEDNKSNDIKLVEALVL